MTIYVLPPHLILICEKHLVPRAKNILLQVEILCYPSIRVGGFRKEQLMKRSPLNITVASLIALSTVLPAISQTYNGQPLQGRVTYVPVGTALDASLTSPIDTAVAKAGDLFSGKLNAPLYLGSDLVLPAGTTLEGQVISSDKSGMVGINGKLGMKLIGAVTPDGIHYPLSAIVTADQDKGIHETKDGQIKGRSGSSTVKSSIVRTALWTGGGTLLGICFAPIVGGAVGAGAIAGVATGGGVGIASNLWRKGKDVKIPSGTHIKFALDQPMSLTTGIASNVSTSSAPVGMAATQATLTH
jgi:hypothetical protein